MLLAIVAVGVGAFNGIRQASRSASANFGLFNQAISGQSDFLIESPTKTLSADVLYSLGPLSGDPDWHLVPVIEGSITSLDGDGEPQQQLRLVGLDLMGLANLPNLSEAKFDFGEDELTWYDWLGSENSVWIGRKTAEKLGFDEGEAIKFIASGRMREMVVGKIIGAESSSFPDDLVIADLPTAQLLLSRPNELSRIESLSTSLSYEKKRRLSGDDKKSDSSLFSRKPCGSAHPKPGGRPGGHHRSISPEPYHTLSDCHFWSGLISFSKRCRCCRSPPTFRSGHAHISRG